VRSRDREHATVAADGARGRAVADRPRLDERMSRGRTSRQEDVGRQRTVAIERQGAIGRRTTSAANEFSFPIPTVALTTPLA